jgi:hypothetical protein
VLLGNTLFVANRAIGALREHGIAIEDESLVHLSSIGWEHIKGSRRANSGPYGPLPPQMNEKLSLAYYF